ncbi:MAG: hypothetical protein M1826_005928 [Phylliscum demangeonii]|nr:MAG: hypothetical protein M1826_005928 [Phylliscum demangeonii]
MCLVVRVRFVCLHSARISLCRHPVNPTADNPTADHPTILKYEKYNPKAKGNGMPPVQMMVTELACLDCLNVLLDKYTTKHEADALWARDCAFAELETANSVEAVESWAEVWNSWVRDGRLLAEDREVLKRELDRQLIEILLMG